MVRQPGQKMVFWLFRDPFGVWNFGWLFKAYEVAQTYETYFLECYKEGERSVASTRDHQTSRQNYSTSLWTRNCPKQKIELLCTGNPWMPYRNTNISISTRADQIGPTQRLNFFLLFWVKFDFKGFYGEIFLLVYGILERYRYVLPSRGCQH